MYYQIPSGDEPKTTTEEELREALRESVRLHLASDVPLGVFLSGGVDSSAVANLAQKASSTPVNTFTLAFDEEAFSEGAIARQVADAIGTTHQEIVLTEAQFAGDLANALNTLDQPTFDGLNSYYISKAVREAGLTVALVGTGGDELFGGYSSFRAPFLRCFCWEAAELDDAGAVQGAGGDDRGEDAFAEQGEHAAADEVGEAFGHGEGRDGYRCISWRMRCFCRIIRGNCWLRNCTMWS